jgi:hypothetical protein
MLTLPKKGIFVMALEVKIKIGLLALVLAIVLYLRFFANLGSLIE